MKYVSTESTDSSILANQPLTCMSEVSSQRAFRVPPELYIAAMNTVHC